MKLREASVIVIIGILVFAAASGWLSSRWLGDDALPEEVAEAIIEDQMNLPEGSIDLTPSSPEKKC